MNNNTITSFSLPTEETNSSATKRFLDQQGLEDALLNLEIALDNNRLARDFRLIPVNKYNNI